MAEMGAVVSSRRSAALARRTSVIYVAGGRPARRAKRSANADRDRLDLPASLSTVQGWRGFAWIAAIAWPITGSIAPVSQPGAASGPVAHARRTWMNSRSRILEIIIPEPCHGEVFSRINI